MEKQTEQDASSGSMSRANKSMQRIVGFVGLALLVAVPIILLKQWGVGKARDSNGG